MRPTRKGILFLGLLNIPAMLVRALQSKKISFNQLQRNIEVKSNEIGKTVQVSQVCNHSIERYESY
jgi:non-homologous end joining protein Ku